MRASDLDIMPRLIPLKPKQLMKILRKHGFEYVSTEGSHMKFINTTTGAKTTVPYGLREISIGTLKSIIKQSKLPEKLFRR